MGLLDVVNGVLAGPRGQPQQQQPQSSKGGVSPVVMAVLGVLAYKALKGRSSVQPADGPTEPSASGGSGGGLGDILGGLGGLLGGAAGSPGGPGNLARGLGDLFGGASAGNVLSGGLSNLINDLTNAGHGEAARSWIGTGPNHPIAPKDLGAALGDDAIHSLSNQTGMSRSDLLAALSRHLPEIVDRLTPNGRLPSEAEAQQIAQDGPPTQRAAGGAG